MSHVHRTPARYVIFGLLTIILLELILAVTWPNGDLRRILFASAILTGLVLIMTCFFVGWAAIEDVREQLARDRVDINQLRNKLAKHIVVHQVHDGLDDALRRLVAQEPGDAPNGR